MVNYRKWSIRLLLLIAGVLSLIITVKIGSWDQVFDILNAKRVIDYENAGIPFLRFSLPFN